MPRLDAYHQVVKQSLINDGWTITHDPLTIKYKRLRRYTDLGAEKALAAVRGGCQMDQVEKLNRYRQIIEQVLETHAKMPAVPETVEGMVVCDPVRDQYLLMDVGWAPYGRAHDVVVHLRLKDNKVWIECDGIEYGIARDLIEAGIPKEDILFALQSREPQPMAELIAA